MSVPKGVAMGANLRKPRPWKLVRRYTKRLGILLATVVLGLWFGTGFGFAEETVNEEAVGGCLAGKTLVIATHPDDSILFMNPQVSRDIYWGRCVETLFLDAGDDGLGTSFLLSREKGAKAAYAHMANVSNSWTVQYFTVNNHRMVRYTLTAKPTIDLLFMRLPDGRPNGSGFAANNYQSLLKLWNGTISSIKTVDSTNGTNITYTKAALIDTLAMRMQQYGAAIIRTDDYMNTPSTNNPNHSDHNIVAAATRAADSQYKVPHRLYAYMGYPITDRAANLSTSQTITKERTFLTYAPYDSHVCQTETECATSGKYHYWFARQYVAAILAPDPKNIAREATVTASSQNTATNQQASKAIDGYADGYPGVSTREWATVGGKSGSWIKLTWSSVRTVSRVRLFDRPNVDDHITAGTLLFSDGSTVTIGSLPDDGTPVTYSFTPRTVTNVKFTITSVSSTTSNIGLTEFQVDTP